MIITVQTSAGTGLRSVPISLPLVAELVAEMPKKHALPENPPKPQGAKHWPLRVCRITARSERPAMPSDPDLYFGVGSDAIGEKNGGIVAGQSEGLGNTRYFSLVNW
jgi:hypothetical protein